MEKNQTQVLSFALLVLVLFFCMVCRGWQGGGGGLFGFLTKNVPQVSVKGPREFSSGITSLPQTEMAFRIFPSDLPLVTSLF